MNVTGHIPRVEFELDVKTDDPTAAVKSFKEKHPEAVVDRVNGQLVLGLCDKCKQPIIDEDDIEADTQGWYFEDRGVWVCYGCKPPGDK
jgi:hypothetical protein